MTVDIEKCVETNNAKLTLSDGSVFAGFSFGAKKSVSGEVVFNTGMVGYPETLTDPSYHGQILVLTYPLIGNYGIPNNDKEHDLLKNFESEKIHVCGLIISDYSQDFSHWNAKKSLHQWLAENGIPGIYGIDTRELTKKIREHGVMLGKIEYENNNISIIDPNLRNLVAEVSIKQKQVYGNGKIKILLIDCGVKNSIIRCFLKRNVTLVRVPWNYDFTNEDHDAILISNGPGDPKQCTQTICNLKKSLNENKPILGICLGNQLLALASGADTYKLKYGHRSQNQPCLEVETKKCFITSQNHGYAVDEKKLSDEWGTWFVNLNDKTNEGIKHKTKPFFSVQFHPEANPGPSDTEFLFDMFIGQIKKNGK
ncbi:MAG: glutamine-hydrolyzing carbamoyl-phosphate synthase small subunit [Nanoarchaeota archaeon]|nr:glutamine-hydrolyzing carbamoyl-phosphate synthase small subunit [Nanoarchaeota archaeon]